MNKATPQQLGDPLILATQTARDKCPFHIQKKTVINIDLSCASGHYHNSILKSKDIQRFY
jgi:hypothetical protein